MRASDRGTLLDAGRLVTQPVAAARPPLQPQVYGAGVAPVRLAPGKHLAVALIPHDGVTKDHPAVFVVRDRRGGGTPAVILSDQAPDTGSTPVYDGPEQAGATPTATASPTATPTAPAQAAAIPFILPKKPGPNDSQALAVNTTDGGVVYDVVYSLVTVQGGADVNEENSAYALASCKACKTVAVSFQLVLVVGQSDKIMPINVAEALNYKCPYCITTAIAKQIVVSVTSQPSADLVKRLTEELKRLDAIDALVGAGGSPADVLKIVNDVQQAIQKDLEDSGQLPPKPSPSATPAGSASPSPTGTGTGTGTATPTPSPSPDETATPPPSATPTPTTSPTATATPTPTATATPTPTATPSETPTTP